MSVLHLPRWVFPSLLASLLLSLMLSLAACGGGGSDSPSSAVKVTSSEPPPDDGPVTAMPAEVTALYRSGGNTASTDVVLFLQGGPIDTLLSEDQLDGLGLALADTHLVFVHQASTLNPAIVANADLSPARAQRENALSVAVIDRLIRHFHAQGKRVHALTHSFGSFLLMRAWVEHPDLAALVTRAVVMNGRLDIPDEVWRGMRTGSQWTFPGGGSPQLAKRQPTRDTLEGDDDRAPGEPPLTRTVVLSQLQLLAAIGEPRMTQRLAGRRLDQMVYVTADSDEAVGRLSAAETRFLRQAGATLYCIAGGSHDAGFEAPHAEALAQLLLGRPAETSHCERPTPNWRPGPQLEL
ncbi:hypothetical protein [Roseateles sp.]|uniref:hypothetical protein n=1 Tax=Roseateles sp. TaxID=1971397 RepID=UPI0031D85211